MSTLRARRWSSYLFVTPYGVSFATFIVVPIVVAAMLSVMHFDLTSRHNISFVGLKNFVDVLHEDYFRKAAAVTCIYVAMIVPSLLIASFTLAIGLNAMSIGRNFVRAMIFLPGMFNVVVASLIWRWFYNDQFGFFNYLLKRMGLPAVHWLSEQSLAMPSIVGMTLWWSLGGATIILLAGLQQIPRQLFEAAMLDGATSPRIFSRITVPQMRPVLMFVTVTSTIGAFQVFGQPYLLTQGGPELSTRGSVQLIYETAFKEYRLGYAAAMSWLLFAMTAVFVIIQLLILRRSSD